MDPRPPVPLESPPCMLCGGGQFSPKIVNVGDWIWQKPGRFTIAQCQDCNLVMTRPRPTREGLKFYYDQAYSGSETVIDAKGFYQSPAGRLMNRYRLVTLAKVRPLEAQDCMLDIGCSYGSFISMAAEESQCSAFGMDIDSGSISRAERADLVTYRVGRLSDSDWGSQRFTIISFIECLEHDLDPVTTLKAAFEVLEPGGLCMVEVPNFRSFWRVLLRSNWLPLLIPQHLVHFTPDTLKRTLEAAGFETLHHQTMFFPLEGVAGIGIILGRIFGPKPTGVLSLGRKMWHGFVDLLLFVLFWILEIPSQIILRLLGLAGHQTIIAQRPTASVPENGHQIG